MNLPVLTLAEISAKTRSVADAWRVGGFALRTGSISHADGAAPPFVSIRRIFNRRDAVWANANKFTRHERRFWRGLVSPEGRERLGTGQDAELQKFGLAAIVPDHHDFRDGFSHRDMKRKVDLTSEALASRRLSRKLGDDLVQVQRFFKLQEETVVPALLESVGSIFDLNVATLEGHRMHRLLDYQMCHQQLRCHAHQDYGTFTLLWADALGLEVSLAGAWVPAFADATIVLAGCALAVVTDGMVAAPRHRVVGSAAADPHSAPRRTAIALFLEPAKAQRLHFTPNSPSSASGSLELTYGDLKQQLRSASLGTAE